MPANTEIMDALLKALRSLGADDCQWRNGRISDWVSHAKNWSSNPRSVGTTAVRKAIELAAERDLINLSLENGDWEKGNIRLCTTDLGRKHTDNME